MVAIYVRRILAGKMTLEDVPTRWREAVETEIEKRTAQVAETNE